MAPAHDAVLLRRNNQVQDAIDGQNLKQALQLIEKRMKKGEDTRFLKVSRCFNQPLMLLLLASITKRGTLTIGFTGVESTYPLPPCGRRQQAARHQGNARIVQCTATNY